MEDSEGSIIDQQATGDDVQEEQVASTEEEVESSEEEQSAEDSDVPEQYRGKTLKEVAEMHSNLEKKLGNHKETEEKARAFDRLIRQKQAPAPVQRPQLSNFVLDDGSIDVKSYDEATAKYEAQKDQFFMATSNKSAQETQDALRAEKDFPFISTDTRSQRMARALYESGEASSLYEAVKEVSEMRATESEAAKKTGAKEKEREIGQKLRSKTEGSSAKSSGLIDEKTFATMTRDEKRAYINKMVNAQE